MAFSGWTPEQITGFVTAVGTVVAALAAIASAIFALVAVRTQRAALVPRIKVTHSMSMPVTGGIGRNLAGSTMGDPWFSITVHNDGLVPVTVRNVGLSFADGGTAPFIRAPWPGTDDLPKPLAAGEEATFYLEELRKVAQVHVEHGGATWATAKIGGSMEYHGERIEKAWLDGWAKA
jgi:hypothetical protein